MMKHFSEPYCLADRSGEHKILTVASHSVPMGDSDGSSNRGRGRRSKVVRLIEEYEIEEIGDELEQLWTAAEDRQSLRELATLFNRRLLQQALEEADVRPLEGEVENIYRLLTGETSGADRTRIRRRLERDGLEVEQLEKDFVTYQAIRTYLKKHRGAEYTPEETDPIEREVSNIQQLRGRVNSVTGGKIEQLKSTENLEIGEFRTLVDIRIVCEDCNTQFDAIELLERGRCHCSDS
jgi:hypothetical protein